MSDGGRVLRAQLVLLLGLGAYIGVAQLVESVLRPGLEPVGWLPTLALVLVPALLLLGYFYVLDRYEPEPTHYVLSVFLLGGLVAGPVASFIVNDLYTVERWATLTPLSPEHIGASFLVVGTAQELCKYLIVRYTVYLSDEFDEPADGIVYATAAGIGFATYLNMRAVAAGIVISTGAIQITITTLAHACFAGAAGYALGRAKFAAPGASSRILAAGLLAAIALNGAFVLLQETVVRPGIDLRPWRGLVLSGIFALAVFGVVSLLMRRSLRPPGEAPTEGRP